MWASRTAYDPWSRPKTDRSMKRSPAAAVNSKEISTRRRSPTFDGAGLSKTDVPQHWHWCVIDFPGWMQRLLDTMKRRGKNPKVLRHVIESDCRVWCRHSFYR